MRHTFYNSRRGFMGLIGLLIVAALIAWWAVTYSPLATTNTNPTGTSTSTRTINTGIDAFQNAIEIKNAMENRSKNSEI